MMYATKKVHPKCTSKYFSDIEKILSGEKDAIIIFGGNFPVYLSGFLFDDKEGNIAPNGEGPDGRTSGAQYVSVGKFKDIQTSFRESVTKLSKKNKIVLIYQIPEFAVYPNMKIFNEWNTKIFKDKKNFKFKPISVSHEVFKERAKESFDLFDSIKGKNILRVYPHELFCSTIEEGRCVAHDEKTMFYWDGNHPSKVGAKMINDLIFKKIDQIN